MSQTEEQQSPGQSEIPKPNIEEKGREVTKHTIRRRVWEHLERNGFSSFPRPVYGRIPNFKGCEEAAAKLSEIDAYNECKNIEINPDKPQEPARILALENNKNLYVPVPRLKEGLLKHISVPEDANKNTLKQAVSRKGIDENGKTIGVNDNIHVDLLVLGSVAVSKEGYRIGKGRGYADLEYAILREMNAVDDETVIVTNVHDSQVFDTLPKELFQAYDVPIDYIITPTEVIKVADRLPKPAGIFWNLLSQRRVNLMPVLQALKEIHEGKERDTTLKEVDTDIESYEPNRFNRFRRFRRKRPRSLGRMSESQGEGDSGENSRPRVQRRRRFFRRRPLPRSEERPNENGDSATGENDQSAAVNARRNQRPRRPFRRNRPQIDFSLMVSNIEKSVRVRDLKNALIERGIKPNDITWRGYKGFCYLHYAKPNSRAKAIEPHQVDNVIEILQNMKISPDSETNLSVKVLEPISRIETTDVTAV
ncbi:hypothetical protein ILUMI_04137 [Ignelater luminosus]|uniref:Methenyltetrahydrofolate synthase domain-containing protein n=1 Tax=Ignelater luminosus TaxID=2038154 RepID=A0A8K0GLG6_IGNLU|nr:hypothetical protein ILUMI_04137 [Ignelater luminosus]